MTSTLDVTPAGETDSRTFPSDGNLRRTLLIRQPQQLASLNPSTNSHSSFPPRTRARILLDKRHILERMCVRMSEPQPVLRPMKSCPVLRMMRRRLFLRAKSIVYLMCSRVLARTT